MRVAEEQEVEEAVEVQQLEEEDYQMYDSVVIQN